MNFDHYDPKNLPKLSPEDEKKPLAPLYYAGRQELTEPELIAAIQPGNPIDPKDAVTPEKLAEKLLDPEWTKTGPKMGYCILPGGVGYACINMDMPGMTMDVRDFHMKWLAQDPGFHYKVWYPGSHWIHYAEMAVEDMGWGMSDLFQGPRPPMSDYGLPENYREVNPQLARVYGRNARSRLLTEDINGKSGYSCVCHVALDGGLRQFTFCFLGAHCVDGKMVNRLAPGEVILEDQARLQCAHFIYENKQLCFLMAKLYPELNGKLPDKKLPDSPERVTKYFKGI